MSPIGLELKVICPFCMYPGTLEPDIVFSDKEKKIPALIGLLVRDCSCQQVHRFKVNFDHGVWQPV